MLSRIAFKRMAFAVIAGLVPICEARAENSLPPRLEAIRERGELRVCVWLDYHAISYRNPRNSEFEGMDIDLARRLADRLTVRVAFVDTSFVHFQERIAAGDCDIAMMAVGITSDRARRVAFSHPYLASPVYAVATRDSTRIRQWADIDTLGTVVAVAAGTVMEDLMGRYLRRAAMLVVTAKHAREVEIQAGRADVFMSDFAYTRRMLLLHDWARVIEPPGRFGESRYAWALPLNDPAWLDEVNRFLDDARADGALARAAARHGLTSILLR